MQHSRISLFAALALMTAVPAFAQGRMDIGLFSPSEGQLEVKVRPSADFDGVFSSLVFALRWDKNTDIALLAPKQSDVIAQHIRTSRSGDVRANGPFEYQVFAGFGFDALQNTGIHWEAGQEYTIMTIPVTGKGTVELVNDEWTGETEVNADFYISLGGADHTGSIYKSLATTTDLDGTVTIQPNPNEGRFTFSFATGEPSDIRIEVLNTLGQSVYTDQLRGFQGSYRKDMDLTTMSDGIYYLKITRAEQTSVHKIVYR